MQHKRLQGLWKIVPRTWTSDGKSTVADGWAPSSWHQNFSCRCRTFPCIWCIRPYKNKGNWEEVNNLIVMTKAEIVGDVYVWLVWCRLSRVVLVARPRRCPTLLNPVPWQNWMAAYLGYTLRMKTLFRGWPIMAHEMHTRRRIVFVSQHLLLLYSDWCGAGSPGTGTLRCLQKEMATYRHWFCVLVARPRRCPTLSNPVPWQNWMAAYLGYTLRMKTLFRGWPIMAHEMHTRRRPKLTCRSGC